LNIIDDTKKLFNSLFSDVNIGASLIDKDGTLLAVNKKVLSMLGSPGEEQTLTVNMLEYLPLRESGISQIIERAFNEGIVFSSNIISYKTKWNVWMHTKNTAIPVMGEDGKPSLVFFVLEDCEQEYLLQEETRRMKCMLETIIERIPTVAVWCKDIHGKYIVSNKVHQELIGKEGIVGKNDIEVWGSELGNKFRNEDIMVASTRETLVVRDEVLAADGNPAVYRTIKTPLIDDENNVWGTVGIGVDITSDEYRDKLIWDQICNLQTILNKDTKSKYVGGAPIRLDGPMQD
jgi:PAS domain-containing protein